MRRAVSVIRYCANITIDIRIVMLTSLPMINTSGDHMPEVWYYAGTHDKLTFRIIVNTPGVAEPMCDNFKPILGWVISPYTSIDVFPFTFQDIFGERILMSVKLSLSFRLSDPGWRGITLQSVQPSVRPPMQAI